MPDLSIIKAYNELATHCRSVIPTHFPNAGWEPTRKDARDFQNDLTILARRVDAVVEAYGKYLMAYDIVTAKELQRYFTDQLLCALDGNALFTIEAGIEKRIEERQDA